MTERSRTDRDGSEDVSNVFAGSLDAEPVAEAPAYASAAAALRARKRAREAAARAAEEDMSRGPEPSAPPPGGPAGSVPASSPPKPPAVAPSSAPIPDAAAGRTRASAATDASTDAAGRVAVSSLRADASPSASPRPAPAARSADETETPSLGKADAESAATRPAPAAAPSSDAPAQAAGGSPRRRPEAATEAEGDPANSQPLARIQPRRIPAEQARPADAVVEAEARPAIGPGAAPTAEGAPLVARAPDAKTPAAQPGDAGAPPAAPPPAAPGLASPPPAPPQAAAARYPAGRALGIGFVGVAVLVFGIFGWGAFANIAGAIIAPGQVEVETRDQVVEHPDGGVVGTIMVEDGDRVQAGDVLLRFDDTLLRSEEAILATQYWELTAWTNRLQAEALGTPEVEFDARLLQKANEDLDVREMVDGQRGLHATRLRSQSEQIEQLRERQTQTREQIRGAEAQIAALERQLALIAQELEGLRSLLEQGLTQLNRVLALEREEARLQGEVGELTANIAQARGQLAEIEIQIVLLSTQRQEQAMDETRRLSYEASGIREQLVAVRERLSRMDVRAPVTGTVFGNTVFAERSVVGPGEPIMFVVPEDVDLIITTQVEITNIDQVFPGQPAALRFSAFSMRTTPELNGHVVKVSADAITDEQRGISYYTAELALDPGEAEKLEGLTLLPGMPVEAYIRTDDRSPLNYLVKPLADYFSRSLREE